LNTKIEEKRTRTILTPPKVKIDLSLEQYGLGFAAVKGMSLLHTTTTTKSYPIK